MTLPTPFTLHDKQLALFWQYDLLRKRRYKVIDGNFVYQTLFSVYAFATRLDNSIDKILAVQANTIFTTVIRSFSAYLQTQHHAIDAIINNTLMLSHTPHKDKASPCGMMFVRSFIAMNTYLTLLNRAKQEGILTRTAHSEHKKKVFSQHRKLLTALADKCTNFHTLRKEATVN